MKLVETKTYAQLMVITDYVLLGVLWVVDSLPLLTVIPESIAARYAIDQWREGATGHIFHHFFQGFRKHLLTNLLLSALTVSLLGTTNLLLQQSAPMLVVSGYAVTIIYLLFLFAWLGSSIRLKGYTLFRLFERSALDMVLYLFRNLGCCVLLLLFSLLLFVFPPFVFIFAGGFWKLIHLLLFRKRREIG